MGDDGAHAMTANPGMAAGLGAAAEDVWQAVHPLVADFSVEVLPEVDSTNTELMRRARAGRLEPVLLAAERQSAGRGRLGRAWRSEPGDSLTFSLGLPLAPSDWSGLSLAVGVTVAEALDARVRIKWPNDLWLAGDRKLAGILVETAGMGADRYVVIGVGINIAQPPGEGLSTPPAGLRELDPRAGAGATLARVAPPLVRAVLAFGQFGFAPFQARFEARDALRDRLVGVTDGAGTLVQGTAHGVSEAGALLVHTASGMKAVTSSEVSVRPAAATSSSARSSTL